MPWMKLHSKLLDAIAYDPAAQTLHVKFRNGRIVDHYRVPQAVVDNLAKAESPGFYYSYYIAPSPRGDTSNGFVRSALSLLNPKRVVWLAVIYLSLPAIATLL